MTNLVEPPVMTNQKRPFPAADDIEDSIPEDGRKLEFIRQFEVIKKWRIGRVADVDVYGCDKLAEESVDPKVHK